MESPLESSIAILTVVVGVPAYFLFKRNLKKTSGEQEPA